MRTSESRTVMSASGQYRKTGIANSRCVSRLLISVRLCLEVDTAQDDAGRSAFELPCQEFASGTLFNPIAQSHELCLALVRPGPRYALQIIHRGSRDGARYLPLAVNHRKQHDHPIKFIAEKVTACERHLTYSFKGQAILQDRCEIIRPEY